MKGTGAFGDLGEYESEGEEDWNPGDIVGPGEEHEA